MALHPFFVICLCLVSLDLVTHLSFPSALDLAQESNLISSTKFIHTHVHSSSIAIDKRWKSLPFTTVGSSSSNLPWFSMFPLATRSLLLLNLQKPNTAYILSNFGLRSSVINNNFVHQNIGPKFEPTAHITFLSWVSFINSSYIL